MSVTQVSTGVIADSAVTAAKLATDAVETAKIKDANVTQAKMASGVAGNGPAFCATGNAQSLSQNAWTKVQCDTEKFDTNSNYDAATNYRFTPTVAGYYQINALVSHNGSAGAVMGVIYKNGAYYQSAFSVGISGSMLPAAAISVLIYMNGSTDYVECYAYSTVSASTNLCEFSGFLARAA